MFNKTIKDLSILVVEDDLETLSLLDMFLKDKFKNVYTASSCEDGLLQFKQNTIDIVVSDIKLPSKSGIDLSKSIREIENSIPIILVTASDNKDLILEALHIGVNHYLFKPVVYDEFSVLLEDISNKLLSRKKLEYKNTLLFDAIEHSSEIVAIVDIDFSLEYINPKFEKLLGDNLNLLRTRSLEDIISTSQHDKKFYEDFISHISSKNLYKGNMYLQNIDGIDLLFDVTMTPNIDKDGTITNYILNGEFIKERLEIKQELKEKTTLHLAQATNRATDAMIKKLSHHWRQPLSVVSTTLQNIQIGFELDHINKEECLPLIYNSLEELNKLSQTIEFFYDKYQNEKDKSIIDFDTFVKESFEFIQEYILESDISIEFNLNVKQEIYICKKNLFEIIMTIIDNAIEEFEQTKQKNKIMKVYTKTDQDNVYIEIFNNGRLIDEKIKHRIFEPYFSTKHVKSGSGLGLYISKEIAIKICKGDLYFENKDDGVSFIIELPKKWRNK